MRYDDMITSAKQVFLVFVSTFVVVQKSPNLDKSESLVFPRFSCRVLNRLSELYSSVKRVVKPCTRVWLFAEILRFSASEAARPKKIEAAPDALFWPTGDADCRDRHEEIY